MEVGRRVGRGGGNMREGIDYGVECVKQTKAA